MGDIRKQTYRTAPQKVPSELTNKAYKCLACGEVMKIDWWEKQDFPKQPMAPPEGGGHWVPISFDQTCACGDRTRIDVPIVKRECDWDLYGDEAERFFRPGEIRGVNVKANYFCITLVALHSTKHLVVQNQIKDLKKRIRPGINPESWNLHFTEIWSGSKDFKHLNKKVKIKIGHDFANILNTARPELYSMNLSSCLIHDDPDVKWKHIIKYQKETTFSTILLTSLQQMNLAKKGVRWHFDHGKIPEKRTGSEGWANEAFLGLQYTPIFSWLAGGSTVLPPKFYEPGSHYLLEIADFISFSVARDFDQAVKGKKSDIPSSLTGKGSYYAFDSKGGLDVKISYGLPLSTFYPDLQF